ncbi:MAG: RNA methyltransferase [Bacteroidia bacterium]|nr:RNA methyltransferase [Bacteroidia bacterium]
MTRKLKNIELNRLTVDEFRKTVKNPVVLVLDNVRSALNVGSVFRTADSFAFEGVYLCGITACPPNSDIRKTALGADESVKWHYAASTFDAITELKKEGYRILIIEQTSASVMLNEFIPNTTQKYALVFGNEVNGVNEELFSMSDAFIEIPQQGSKHSLNIAVSAGIVCWHFFTAFK